MQRPTGIVVLTILYIVNGGLSLFTSGLSMALGALLATRSGRLSSGPSLLVPAAAYRGDYALWLGLLGTAAALFKLTAAAGLWMLQPWGWQLALAGTSLKLVTHLVAAFRRALTPAGLVGALLNLGVLVYLLTPNVRRALSGAPEDPWDDATLDAALDATLTADSHL